MSSTVIEKGYVAELADIFTAEEREDWNEQLYDAASGLSINHEGTLIYSNVVPFKDREDFYGLRLGKNDLPPVEDFKAQLVKFGLAVVTNPVPYWEIYHNGGDSGISMLTLEEFHKSS